ncbi:MAG: DUF3772 domain-containing protein [Pseudomonadota bacterium]
MRLLVALFAVWLALPAFAQNLPNYELWERVASRAEEAVENARASDGAFESLREEIDQYRAEFATAQNINAPRLQTLRAQLEALGPAPAEGEAEADGVAERRAELNAQLRDLAAPGVRAGESFRRADGIIREIDAILRERRAAAIFTRGPPPFQPSGWRDALWDLGNSLAAFQESVERSIQTGAARVAFRTNLPLILTLLVIALVFVVRGRRWLEILGERVEGDGSDAGLRVSGFIISLGQIIVPMIGVLALTRALILTDLFAFEGEEIIALLPAFGLAFFVARWLAGRLFPKAEAVRAPITTPDENYGRARSLLLTTGVALVAYGVMRALGAFDNYALASRSVLEFPLFLLMGYLIYRLGRLLSTHEPTKDEEGEVQPSVLDRMVVLLARLAKIVGVAAPFAALLGYVNLAEFLIVPTIHTLALFAVVGLLIDLARDVYVLLARQKAADESLIPVIVAIALILCSVPVLALIWGATVNDLREVLVRVSAGITLGETTISPGSLLLLLVVFLAGYLTTRFVQSALRTSVLPKTRLDIGGQSAMVSGVGYIGIFLAGLLAISAAGIDLTSLAFIAGALGVGIGFGLQNIVSNFISGIILLVERPISEGDWIEVGANMGYVRDISVRSTRIETFDRTDVIVPNADLISGTVTNYTRGNTVGRAIVPVGVAYGTDTKRVEAILREIAEAHPMVTLNPPPFINFKGFGASSLDFEIRAILRDVSWILVVKTEMNHAIAKRFAEEGIEIPFAQQDIWLRNPEALRGEPATDAAPDAEGQEPDGAGEAPGEGGKES